MKAKDHFIDWLREKILQNPQEPPTGAWQEISDGLDLEESWEKIGEELEFDSIWNRIDSRLSRYNEILRFERLGYVFSAAAALVLLFGTFLLPPSTYMGKSTAAKDFSGVPADSLVGEESSTGNLETVIAGKERKHDKSQIEVEKPSQKETNSKARAEKTQIERLHIQQNSRRKLFIGSSKGYVFDSLEMEFISFDPANEQILTYFEEERDEKDAHLYPAQYIGGGSAIKMSWLLNKKTFHAMERASLVTAAPAYQADWYLLYGTKLKNRLFLQGDLYLKNIVGQEYEEYRNGQYGRVKDEFHYQSLALTLSNVRKQIGGGKYPTFSRLSGGIYAGRLQSANEITFSGSTDKTSEYGQIHLGAIGAYEYDTFLSEQFIFSYGIRSRLDLLNIYSGTDTTPAAFHKTRAFSLDFSFSLKYVLK